MPHTSTDAVQPLLFTPRELLACGLRDAHHHPLVGERTLSGGVRSWRTSPAAAWQHPLVELGRTANSFCSIVLDCDSRESVALAYATVEGWGPVPQPNFLALRPASGHVHVGWNLRTPVHRGDTARPRPLAMLGRIAEHYAEAMRSDKGYVGVLSYNPVHSDYHTTYPRFDPFDLDELAEAIPARWRRPARAADLATQVGRNSHLFAALCALALRCSDDGLLTWASTLNQEYSVPLPYAEVRGTWRSVCRYRARWRASGHQQAWLWKQAARGKRGGLLSRGGGRSRVHASNSDRQRMYREPTANTHGGTRPGAGRKQKQSSVTKQANTDRRPPSCLWT